MKSKSLFLITIILFSFHVFAKGQEDFVSGEVLVKLKGDKAREFLSRKSKYSLNVKELLNTKSGNFALLKSTDKSISINKLISNLEKDSAVIYAEPNYKYYAISMQKSTKPTDPMFSELWGLNNTGNNEPAGTRGNSKPSGVKGIDINALKAWKLTKGSKKIKIAVIDTGVDYNHPDLKKNIWVNTAEKNGLPGVDDDGNGYIDDIHGYDFANDDGDPMDGNGHGTHCAGTIAAEHNNGIGVSGVMAHASIIGIKFLTDAGGGDTFNAVKSIEYAIKMNVDIMSNSWGGKRNSQALEEAIQNASNAGIIFTAAAGNSASNNNTEDFYPANYKVENIISVAANNYNNTLAYFSSFGSRTVHITAPGRNILSTTNANKYEVLSGTSMATPHVSGVLGLYIALHGKTPVTELKDKLLRSSVYAKDYSQKIISKGRVDAYAFLNNEIADRPYEPSPDEWQSQKVNHESIHPYGDFANTSKDFTIEGARFIRVVFEKIDVETNWDFVMVRDTKGAVIDKITGLQENYTSEFIEGDTINIGILADASNSYWGYKVSQIQFVK